MGLGSSRGLEDIGHRRAMMMPDVTRKTQAPGRTMFVSVATSKASAVQDLRSW